MLLIDWPDIAVPEGLARAGHDVWVKGGPGEDDYARWPESDGEVVAGAKGPGPERADMVYMFRPLEEAPAVVGLARSLGARTLWHQSGRDENGRRDPKGVWLSPEDAARLGRLVTAAGLVLVWDRYILDGSV